MKKVYEIITDRIVKSLEEGKIPWVRPWINNECPKNLISGKEYRGINTLLLGCQGFETPIFLTFKQCSQLGGNIKKGEHGTPIVYWNWIKSKDMSEDGEIEKAIPFLRYYVVFNLEQTEGLNIKYDRKEFEFKPIEQAEKIINDFLACPEIKHTQQRAFYSPNLDFINMPKQNSFPKPENYYSVLFHELSHATGHESRLNRKTLTDLCPFGSTNYSKEELIAEISACFLCANIGVENDIDNSKAYIQGWVKKFKDKPKMIITASAQAEKATNFILGKKTEKDN